MTKIDDIYEAVDDFGLITSAEAAELGGLRSDIDQPTMRRDHMSITRAAYSHPRLVFT